MKALLKCLFGEPPINLELFSDYPKMQVLYTEINSIKQSYMEREMEVGL